jgi:cytochrome c553
MNKLILPLTAAALLAAAAVDAQTPANEPGRQIAANGTSNGVAACAGCHGANGEGNASANFPRIAGQPAGYLQRQLRHYADGSRDHPVMTPIAKGLSEQQAAAVAGYYAVLKPSSAKPVRMPDSAAIRRGQLLANIGDEKIGVQSCANCHGPGAGGQPPNIPALAGQHRGYLEASLAAWKNATRKTDASRQMNTIAKRLSDADIAAVSAYFAALPATPPETPHRAQQKE